jgi:protease-4
MTLESDLLIDRRRLKRRLTFWRIGTFVAVIAAILAIAGVPGGAGSGGAHVARLNLTGTILENRKLLDRILALAGSEDVRAVIVTIDSAGGSVAGGESLHRAIATVAEKKPVVAVMRGLAASAGYMVALPAAHIFAREATITGSIGVVIQTTEISGLMKTLGISADTIASGPLKAEPSFTRPLSPQGRAVLQGMVADMNDLFVDMVARGRRMDVGTVRQLADGRAYTGRQALKLGLIDAIGGESEARAWLTAERQIPASLPVRDVVTRTLSERVLDAEGESLFGALWKVLTFQKVTLDGAWAIWQPERE